MSYMIGQYHHTDSTGDDSNFLTPITGGTVSRTNALSSSAFSDECIRNITLTAGEYYYFTCQIKKMLSVQTFNVHMIYLTDSAISNVSSQFVKTITIPGGDIEEWVPVEFTLAPIFNFNAILFELNRTNEDYRVAVRYPKIAYQQLGHINSLTSRVNGAPFLKIGVQSKPGLNMCINGEEIHVGRTGIFELRDGTIPISFFSIVNPATEVDSTLEDWKLDINEQINEIEEDPSLTPTQKEAAYAAINSRQFFGTTKYYKINNFTLDFLYDEEY